MSVLIRGMEMPTSCDNCWALDDYGDYPRCRITEEQRGYNFPVREKRMDKCPLVPAADVAPVQHGRWKVTKEEINWYLSITKTVCSECGKDAFYDDCYGYIKTDYCPNCGSIMDKDGDGE